MKKGRIIADIGEDLKRKFKSKLGLEGLKMTDWLKEVIGEFVKKGEKHEFD